MTAPYPPHNRRARPGDFLSRLIRGLLELLEQAEVTDHSASQPSPLARLDPRFKILGLFALILTAVWVNSLTALACLFGCALALACLAPPTIWVSLGRAWLGVLLFTGGIALPALVLVPGEPLASLPLIGWTLSLQGARAAVFLVGRAETSATLALLVVLTTPMPQVLKALRGLGMPQVLVALLGITHRYLFLLLITSLEMLEARRSRIMGHLPGPLARRLAIAQVGVLLETALHLGSEVHLAMLSRGYRGEPRLLHEFQSGAGDWLALAGLLTLAGLTLGMA